VRAVKRIPGPQRTPPQHVRGTSIKRLFRFKEKGGLVDVEWGKNASRGKTSLKIAYFPAPTPKRESSEHRQLSGTRGSGEAGKDGGRGTSKRPISGKIGKKTLSWERKRVNEREKTINLIGSQKTNEESIGPNWNGSEGKLFQHTPKKWWGVGVLGGGGGGGVEEG